MIFRVLVPIPALDAQPGDFLVVRPLGGGVDLVRSFSNAEALHHVSTEAVVPMLPSADELRRVAPIAIPHRKIAARGGLRCL